MHILWIIRKGKQIAYTNGIRLIVHNDNRIASFSWMRYIVISQPDMDEAGETVINQGIEARQYQLLLIKKAVGSRLYFMANSFNHSNLKKRITMIDVNVKYTVPVSYRILN